MLIAPVPPCLPEANQKDFTSILPSVPKMRSIASCSSDTEQDTSATIPPGKPSTAEAHSSTPVLPRCPAPATLRGSRNGFPFAAPAISRAIETG